jgi:hypothetical protein
MTSTLNFYHLIYFQNLIMTLKNDRQHVLLYDMELYMLLFLHFQFLVINLLEFVE